MSKCSTISSRLSNQPLGSGAFDPFFGGKEKAVAASLVFNSLEFEGIEISVVESLPYPEKKDGVLVFEPLFNERASSLKMPHHIRQGNIVLLPLGDNGNGGALNLNSSFVRLSLHPPSCNTAAYRRQRFFSAMDFMAWCVFQAFPAVKLAEECDCFGEATMSLKWIAETLKMDAWSNVNNHLRPERAHNDSK